MGQPFGDVVDAEALRAALLAPDGPYRAVDVVPSTGSTNADLVAAARAGAPDRSVLIAGEQTGGRGRLDRRWVSPAGSGLYLSVLLRCAGVPSAKLGWIPLLAGVAVVRAVEREAGVPAKLKWPNDLLAGPDEGKCAGILAELATPSEVDTPAAVVVGVGLNVRPLPDGDAVPPGAGGLPPVSLAGVGAFRTDHTVLAEAILRQLAVLDDAWRATGGDASACGLLAAYRGCCGTLGRAVRVELAEGRVVTGLAGDVDGEGRLLLRSDDGELLPLSAGDVIHLRPEPPAS